MCESLAPTPCKFLLSFCGAGMLFRRFEWLRKNVPLQTQLDQTWRITLCPGRVNDQKKKNKTKKPRLQSDDCTDVRGNKAPLNISQRLNPAIWKNVRPIRRIYYLYFLYDRQAGCRSIPNRNAPQDLLPLDACVGARWLFFLHFRIDRLRLFATVSGNFTRPAITYHH